MIEFIAGCFVGAVGGIIGLALMVAADDKEQSRPDGWPESE